MFEAGKPVTPKFPERRKSLKLHEERVKDKASMNPAFTDSRGEDVEDDEDSRDSDKSTDEDENQQNKDKCKLNDVKAVEFSAGKDEDVEDTEESKDSDRSTGGNKDHQNKGYKLIDYGEDKLPDNGWEEVLNLAQKNCGLIFCAAITVVLAVCIFMWQDSTMAANEPKVIQNKINMKELRESFLSQKRLLWEELEAAIDDVIMHKRPSTLILLYQENSERTLEKLLKRMSEYATCKISKCSEKPIILTSEMLNSPKVIDDYGILIEEYQGALASKGVMIIRNLENINGESAQAFHTFCDKDTPLVEKSLFIFTMKIEKFHVNNQKFVEGLLRSRWTNLKTDDFYPLLTRITNAIVDVLP